VYWPDAPRAKRVEPGTDVQLDRSTVVDATLGPETAYGLFCEAPVELEPLRASFQAAPEAPPLPKGCHVDRMSFVKKASP
jgi:hypothetical protein